jgi:hypothetical protein
MEVTSPIDGLSALAYLALQAARLDARGVENVESAEMGVEITPFEDLSEGEREAWESVVVTILGANKMLLVPTPVPLMAEHAKHAHDRAVMVNLTLPGTRVGPEWDAAVLAALDSAHFIVPTEVARVQRRGNQYLSLDGGELYLPERIKDGDKVLIAFVPIDEDPDETPPS